MNLKETLKTLCAPPGVSGIETAASEVARRLLSEYMPNAGIDSFGTVWGVVKYNDGMPLLLLDAHIDEIGMVVNFIDKNGFLKVSNAGGIDRRVLPAASVTVWGGTPLKGVVCTLPPHVQKDSGKAIQADEIAIDCGLTKESAEKRISLGDTVTIDADFAELQNGMITARALDDRAGVAAILYALDLLKNKNPRYNLAVTFSSQEELGCRGAGISAFNINPDCAVAVDVSYGDYPGGAENKTWKLGAGVMIGISPVLDRELFDKMKDTAQRNNIPCQIEVMGGKTGTDADSISVARAGVRCALLSIPLRNMHTPVEAVSLSDIENTGRLIAGFVLGDN